MFMKNQEAQDESKENVSVTTALNNQLWNFTVPCFISLSRRILEIQCHHFTFQSFKFLFIFQFMWAHKNEKHKCEQVSLYNA